MRTAGHGGAAALLSFIVVSAAVSLVAGCGDHPSSSTCGRACPTGSVCQQGACVAVCDPGVADCNHDADDGCEVTVADDPANCGACGHACTAEHGTPACVDGHCAVGACDPGFADCDQSADDGCEQDLASTPSTCGACDHSCDLAHATAACHDGHCTVDACDDGFDDCDHLPDDGCEADLGTTDTCRSCGPACAGGPHATATCTADGCGLACDDGHDDCNGLPGDGCEAELATSETDCGMCGHPCGDDETCEGGTCTPVACTAPLADCDHLASNGCEVNTDTDADHCGTCGVACPVGSTCSGGHCTSGCATQPDDPVTGQRCPIEAACTASSECGTQLGAPTFRYWYCSTTTHTCQFLPQVGGFMTAGGTCTGQLVFRQLTAAPYDKRIVPPDGVAFRTGTTIAIEVTNTTATDLYLDQLPITLELAGTNPSRFDVSAVRLYEVGSISDYGDGNNATLIVCSSPTTPFAASSTFTLGTGATGGCGGSTFSRVRAGMSQRFLLDLTFSAATTFLEGRDYRLRIGEPLTGVRARTSTAGTAAAYTACTLPAGGFSGSYLEFANP